MTEAKIYLGNLSYDARERDIEKFLKGYGYVRNISVKVAPTPEFTGIFLASSRSSFTSVKSLALSHVPSVKSWLLHRCQVSKLWHLHKCQNSGTFTSVKSWHLQKCQHSGTFTSVKKMAPTHLQHLGRIRVR